MIIGIEKLNSNRSLNILYFFCFKNLKFYIWRNTYRDCGWLRFLLPKVLIENRNKSTQEDEGSAQIGKRVHVNRKK